MPGIYMGSSELWDSGWGIGPQILRVCGKPKIGLDSVLRKRDRRNI